MKSEYDFSRAKRGPVISQGKKSRITIYLDSEVIDAFRSKAEASGKGYQTMINDALRDYLDTAVKPLNSRSLRRILREELSRASDGAD